MQKPIIKLGTELPIGKVVSIHKDGCKVEKEKVITNYTLSQIEEFTK